MSKLGSHAQIWKTLGDIMVIYVNEEMNINYLSVCNGYKTFHSQTNNWLSKGVKAIIFQLILFFSW